MDTFGQNENNLKLCFHCIELRIEVEEYEGKSQPQTPSATENSKTEKSEARPLRQVGLLRLVKL